MRAILSTVAIVAFGAGGAARVAVDERAEEIRIAELRARVAAERATKPPQQKKRHYYLNGAKVGEELVTETAAIAKENAP